MKRSVLAPLSLILASLVAPPSLAACVISKLAELPVTMSQLRPSIHARIEGTDVRLLADSGAFFSIISPGTARELNLKTTPAPFGFAMKGVGGFAEASFVTAHAFILDTIPLHNVGFIVGGSEVGADIAGLIGRNILNYADTEYDLATGAIRIVRPTGCGDRPLAYWAAGKAIGMVEMLTSEQRFPATIVQVTVNGVRMKAALDTGASTSVLMLSAATRAGLATSGPIITEEGAEGGIGRHTVHGFTTPVDTFEVGGEQIKRTRIRVLDTKLDEVDMLLGADFFLSHRVFVANSQHKVYFTYNGGPVFNLAAPPPEAPKVVVADAKIEGEPADAAAFSRRGQAFASRGDHVRALADLDRAVALAPTEPDYLYQRGVARLQAQQPFLAMADMDQVLKLEPGNAMARLTRAQLRLGGHDPAGAIADLDEVAGGVSKAADARLPLAELYDGAGKPEQALEQYGLWLTAHPDDFHVAVALNGRCWNRSLLNRDLDKVLVDCDRAVRLNPKEAMVLDSRGLAHLRRGEFDLAIADYDRALALRPKQAWSLYGRGLAKLRRGQAEGGKTDLLAAVAVNPAITAQTAKFGLTP